MSSLLDVLHRRPSRSQLAVEPAAAAQAVAGPPSPGDTVEMTLAPELEFATGAHEAPASQDAVPGPGLPSEGATTALRRWTDARPTGAAEEPARAAPRAAAPTPPRRLQPVLVALGVASVVFAAFLAWRFTGEAEESFLADPASLPPAPEVAATPVEPPPAARPAPAAVKKPARRNVATAPERAPAEDPAERAWYDEPALPAVEEPGAPLIQITRGTTADPRFDRLSEAYAALLAGDGARAESLYRDVLAADAGNIDALLGLGSLAARGGRTAEARDLFRHVQLLDPKNGTAAAALSALPGAAGTTGTESDLKHMLREQPEVSSLHFALGLRYVADGRWGDAQLAFFEAVRHDPTNADYAFNLAVSLDRIGQRGAASSYYQRAIDLASGAQRFDIEAARARLEALRAAQG